MHLRSGSASTVQINSCLERKNSPGFSPAKNKVSPPPKAKTPWTRLKNSHLIVDRHTGDFYTLTVKANPNHPRDLVPGDWITVPQNDPNAPPLEYLASNKRFKCPALKIGPVSSPDPVEVTISLDENDENERFQVIF